MANPFDFTPVKSDAAAGRNRTRAMLQAGRSRPTAAPAPVNPPRRTAGSAALRRTPPPAPRANRYVAPRGGGGGGGGGVAAPAPAPAAPSITPEQDHQYMEQLAALQAAMANYNTDYNNNVSQYNVQYGDAMRNLGWSAAAKGAVDNPATASIDESQGLWNQNDSTTASGRGYQNQLNDFSGRGLLQSSYYAQALNDLFNSLNQQRGSVDTAKTNYLNKLTSEKTQFGAQNTLQIQNARREAANRIAMGITG